MDQRTFQRHQFRFDHPLFEEGSKAAFHLPPTDQNTEHLYPETISINEAAFLIPSYSQLQLVSIVQQEEQTLVFCDCNSESGSLCSHETTALHALLNEELLVFFNKALRENRLKKFAADYGLEHEPALDQYFQLELVRGIVHISPSQPGLFPVNLESLGKLYDQVHPVDSDIREKADPQEHKFVVLKQHKFYKHLQVELFSGQKTQNGKLKNPLKPSNPQNRFWEAVNPEELKFLMGLIKFQNRSEGSFNGQDIRALKAIIANPSSHPIYYHLPDVSESITPASLHLVQVRVLEGTVKLKVTKKGEMYELSGSLADRQNNYELADLPMRFGCFLEIDRIFHLITDEATLRIVSMLTRQGGSLLVHANRFQDFKTHFLDRIDDKIAIEHTYLPEANADQQEAIRNNTEQLIYLSDFGEHVMIIPVVRYGEAEVSVRTKREVYNIDERGNTFHVQRDNRLETNMVALLIRQHPEFEEQLENPLDHFYLSKKEFLNEEWFLDVFETWEKNGITVLGFNELSGNKFNPHKGTVNIQILSGINWFNAKIDVRFGKKMASLKKVQSAVKHKNRYIKLDDGTVGILPKDWVDKFSEYFEAAREVEEDALLIAKMNFEAVDRLFEQQALDAEVQEEIALYRGKAKDFKSIEHAPIPADLKGELRPYQQEGLNWLNFLDDFNFGGCLADDMGLGKSLQVIAFVLLQRQKVTNNNNLLVVPTTLMFNWRKEIEKFAPSIKVLELKGPGRSKETNHFEAYELMIISYHNLLTDVHFLKNYAFNYVILDESQHIKNPDSQRYKACCLLRSRNRLVLTGTPVENNTFDLYSQFSFACPGLLGSRQYFKELYAIPIDRFQDRRRMRELQQKIQPFMLRRTKEQVASELPLKSEQVLYCEMDEVQRKIYDTHEKELRDFLEATDAEKVDKPTMYVLRGLTRLRQICNSPRLLDDRKGANMESSTKLQVLMEHIDDHVPHHKILIFSQFVTMLELIREELVSRNIDFSMLTGSTKNREAVVSDFQTTAQKRIFLISLKAGGTGLNLTEANYVYLVDPWWNPAVENQAIDRVYRIGQQRNVSAFRMICPDTVEEKIMNLQAEKRKLAGGLMTEDVSFFKSLSRDQLLNLLR